MSTLSLVADKTARTDTESDARYFLDLSASSYGLLKKANGSGTFVQGNTNI